jgi:hypothetical protein
MVVKVDENEPNNFPPVSDIRVEAKHGDDEIGVILIVRIDGKSVRVRVRLDRKKSQMLAEQLSEALGL